MPPPPTPVGAPVVGGFDAWSVQERSQTTRGAAPTANVIWQLCATSAQSRIVNIPGEPEPRTVVKRSSSTRPVAGHLARRLPETVAQNSSLSPSRAYSGTYSASRSAVASSPVQPVCASGW